MAVRVRSADWRWAWAALIWAGILVSSGESPVRANPQDAFGFGGRGPAMGNAHVADARDLSSVYYNPATMFLVPPGEGLDHFALTTLAAVDDLYIRNRAGDDLSNPVINSYNVGMGMVDGIGTPWFRAGLNFQIPVFRLQLQRTNFPDEREAFFSNRLSFEFYGGRFQRQVVMPAVAFRPHRTVAFGAGVSLFTFSQTDTDVYLADVIDQSKAFINLRGDQRNTNSLTYGLLFWPMDNLRVGAVYRDSESFVIRGISKVEIEDFHQFSDQLLDFRVQFRPSQAGVGAAYQVSDALGVSGDMVWYRWSRYRDLHNERPSPSFNDTYSPRVGVEYLWTPMWVFRGGYAFEPTPIPPQTGRTNYVDNHKNILSGGLGFRLPAEGYVASFDLFGQIHLLIPRETAKEAAREDLRTTAVLTDFNVSDTRENPGWPGFESGGRLYVFGLTFSVGR